jgi:RNA polymerase sigma-70 factor, ECF subfamily
LKIVDTMSSQPGDLVLPLPITQESRGISAAPHVAGVPSNLIHELWRLADAATCGLTSEEFGFALAAVGTKFNHGLPPGLTPDSSQRLSFFQSLRLSELALAHACALGREAAWQRFVDLYQSPLTQAAIAIAGSATLGHELAESLYAELYGLRQIDGERHSPLASYSGRGSLLGWLRTTLAQRRLDYYRRTYRETPLDSLEAPAAEPAPATLPEELARLKHAVTHTLQALPPEDRFLLVAYFLDGQTLLQIARTLHVHEATISRRLKRLAAGLRQQILHNLQSGGLSTRAAEEALGTDPRDIEINLRALLQTSQAASFPDRGPSNTVPHQL